MSLWQGKSRGNQLGYRIFVWILKNFGVQPAYFLLKFVVLYFFLFSFKSSRQLYHLYHHRLKIGWLNTIAKLYKNYNLLGQSIIDKVVIMAGIPNKFTFNFDGEENLRDIAALKQGGMLLSAHVGNWDIAGYLLKRLDTKINIVIFDGEYQKIKEYLDKVTGKQAVNVIVIRNDLSHIYAINDAFKNNELVCMHADRYIAGNKILTTEFLGEEAKFPMGPFLLAAQFKVPVSFVFALKETSTHYHFFASKPIEYDQTNKSNMMQAMLDDFAKAMESKLKAYPAQWFNYYDFWKK